LLFQQIYERFPDSYDAKMAPVFIAICHSCLGQDEEAIQSYQKVVREYPWWGHLLGVIGLFPHDGPPERMEVSLPVCENRPAGLFSYCCLRQPGENPRTTLLEPDARLMIARSQDSVYNVF
jgi:hypothetical protein